VSASPFGEDSNAGAVVHLAGMPALAARHVQLIYLRCQRSSSARRVLWALLSRYAQAHSMQRLRVEGLCAAIAAFFDGIALFATNELACARARAQLRAAPGLSSEAPYSVASSGCTISLNEPGGYGGGMQC
jgi:hypothetical protein